MNTFKVGNRVKCKNGSRRNGLVIYLYCKLCDNCASRNFASCSADDIHKIYVGASFYDHLSETAKRYRYNSSELELDTSEDNLEQKTYSAPLATKELPNSQERVLDLNPRDIRPLRTNKIDVPLIEPDDIEDNFNISTNHTQLDESESEPDDVAHFPAGMTLNEFLEYTVMKQPI